MNDGIPASLPVQSELPVISKDMYSVTYVQNPKLHIVSPWTVWSIAAFIIHFQRATLVYDIMFEPYWTE